MFLTVSFFVLFVARKTDMQDLKIFGYVVVALLWICAISMFTTGIHASLSRGGMMPMRRGMMMQEKQMAPTPMPNSPTTTHQAK
ncbi:MAG: hypothetical protein ABSE81_00195 [Candidatus Omnitrophota bacterium]